MSQSRRQRRQMAKQLGLLGRKESLSKMGEKIRRAQKMGKQIHLRNLEQIKNNQIEAERNREREIQNTLAMEVANKESTEESNVELNSESFDFLDDVKGEPEASSENVI